MGLRGWNLNEAIFANETDGFKGTSKVRRLGNLTKVLGVFTGEINRNCATRPGELLGVQMAAFTKQTRGGTNENNNKNS